MNYCQQFTSPCESPEPWASLTDIISASQYLEAAIHAPTMTLLNQAVHSAVQQLGYAQHYFQTLGNTYLEERTMAVANELASLPTKYVGTTVVGANHLANLQTKVLYGYQGVISRLYREVYQLWLKA